MLTRPCENGRSPTTNSESRVLQTSSGPPLTQGIGRVYRKEYRSSSSSVVFERGTELGFLFVGSAILARHRDHHATARHFGCGHSSATPCWDTPREILRQNGWGRLFYSLYLWQQL